jgi:hypothetical protein
VAKIGIPTRALRDGLDLGEKKKNHTSVLFLGGVEENFTCTGFFAR